MSREPRIDNPKPPGDRGPARRREPWASLEALLASLKSRPIGYRILRGTLWSILGNAGARVSVLIAGVFVARLLGKEGFGALGTVQNTVIMFQVFAGFGMGLTATKHVAQFRAQDPRRAGRIIALSGAFSAVAAGLICVLLCLLAPWLAGRLLAAPTLAADLRVSSVMLFFGTLLGTHSGALAGFEAFDTIARANLVASALSLPVVIGGAMLWGVTGAVWGLGISMTINWLLIWRALHRHARSASVPMDLTGLSGEWGIVWGFGLPALLAGVVVVPVNWLCTALLVNRADGYAEMGIFNAANQWRVAALQLPILLGQVVTPMLVEQLGEGDPAPFRRLVRLTLKVNALVTVPAILVLIALSPFIMSLYGPGFEGAAPVLAVILLTAALMAIELPVGNVIAAMDRMWIGFFMNLGWGVVALGLTWLALPLGALGLALGQLGGYLVHGIWTFAFVRHALAAKSPLATREGGR